MNYSNTVVMHAAEGYTRENILSTYMMNKILLRKIGKEKRIAGKKKIGWQDELSPTINKCPAIAIGLEEPLLNRLGFDCCS